ncbi:glycoside hydrolase family 3 protein [Candidatus Dojkabacteria bacterium]|nr:glycoside hydrolase family 3 protein [Candidatus Dojkabacteria bacterium]
MIIDLQAHYQKSQVVEYYETVQSPLCVGIDDLQIEQKDIEFLDTVKPSCIILLGNNIRDYTQTKQLIEDIHNYAKSKGSRIRVSVDEEGGIVSRFKNLEKYPKGFTGMRGYDSAQAKKQSIFLKEIGIDMNLAPVVDIAYKPTSALSIRSAGNSPAIVTRTSSNYIKTLREHAIESTPKHFPGLGRTSSDTHFKETTVEITKEEWHKTDAVPYIAAIEAGAENIMLGHVIYPKVDTLPATISKMWVEILRGELGFKGRIVTDDLKMLGLENFTTSYHCKGDIVKGKEPNHAYAIKNSLDAGINTPLIILSEEDMLRTYYEWISIEKKCI